MTSGFCYVADRSGYVKEAITSANSLKQEMPTAKIALVCPPSLFPANSVFDYHIPSDEQLSGPIAKVQAIEAPFDEVMLLDTDTFVAGDLHDAFRVLEHFDVAAGHEPTRGWDYPCDAPSAFCEFNTGVVLFRKNDQVRLLFRRWLEHYHRMRETAGLVNDQPAFRSAIWQSDPLRIATLPSEFHCIVGKPVSIAWEARILHGRGDLPTLEREINCQLGYRAFVPGWGQLRGYAGRRQLINQFCKLSVNFLKILLLPHFRSDTSDAAPEQWWTNKSSFGNR
jgi:hypothetical protein